MLGGGSLQLHEKGASEAVLMFIVVNGKSNDYLLERSLEVKLKPGPN